MTSQTFLSKIYTRVASIFSRTIQETKSQKSEKKVDPYAASVALVKSISSTQNPQCKTKVEDQDLDFHTNSAYFVFTETVERYVPIRKDLLPIDKSHIITVIKQGPESAIYPIYG